MTEKLIVLEDVGNFKPTTQQGGGVIILDIVLTEIIKGVRTKCLMLGSKYKRLIESTT